MVRLITGDCRSVLPTLEAESINCCVTSPPYHGLRDYGVDGQIGLEETLEQYVDELVMVFREVRRVLRNDGTLWLNLGDCYANKNLIGLPWRVAFALQADGWWLRSDIVWHKCLSGGCRIYATTRKGVSPCSLKDVARLDPSTVQLWNGTRWTQLISITPQDREGDELQLILRSGESIGCTPDHRWPTQRGLVESKDLQVGDVLATCTLPDNDVSPCKHIPDDLGWFIGLYLAEGSRDSRGCIQIAGHIKETDRATHCRDIAKQYDGTCSVYEDGNSHTIVIRSKVLEALLDTYIVGNTAKRKHLTRKAWHRSNDFLMSLLQGYLHGDGHYDPKNDRWQLGFTRNTYLESDLRCIAARLGLYIRIRSCHATCNGQRFSTFRGELRFSKSGHFNTKHDSEIVEIRKANGRNFYDVVVADDPHTFALASGVLTHNSNPMPESIKDRPTRAHEYIFLFAKSHRYYYDADAIREEPVVKNNTYKSGTGRPRYSADGMGTCPSGGVNTHPKGRNKRDVWTLPTKGYKGCHFATFPPDLIRPCVLAGCPVGGVVLDPFSGAATTGLVCQQEGRDYVGVELNEQYNELARARLNL